jgi:hypothetical protein
VYINVVRDVRFNSCAADICGAVRPIVRGWYLFRTWNDAVVAKCDVLHRRLTGGTKENGERSQYSRRLDWKLQVLPTEPSCSEMILVVGVTVLGNRHAVNHRNMEIVTDKIENYNKHINNPNKQLTAPINFRRKESKNTRGC